MAKFMLLYNASVPASEFMANSSPEQMQAGMEAWNKWRDEIATKGFTMEFGMPMQAVGRVTPDGETASHNEASGYSLVEGESKDHLMELLKTHPHLGRPGASIDVLELLAMPGLDA